VNKFPDFDDAPTKTVTLDLDEFRKCTSTEQLVFLHDLLHLESRGYFSRAGRPKIAWASIDLDNYGSIDELIGQCRKIHKGNAVRDALKAEKRGCYGRFFDFRSYAPDIVAINTSAPARQGRPMTAHYQHSVEDYGGYPKGIAPERVPSQAATWVRHFGLFQRHPGHRQGDVVSDEQLLAYIALRRYGNFAIYSTIIGHADHLQFGIMYKMHLDLVSGVIATRNSATGDLDCSQKSLDGLRYLCYSAFYYIQPGLQLWKRRMLFEPCFLQFDYLAGRTVEELCGVAEQVETAEWQLQCAGMLTDLARRCMQEGRQGEAIAAHAEIVAMLKRLTGREPTNSEYRERLASGTRNFDELKRQLGDCEPWG
jgi:hypothetical protein